MFYKALFKKMSYTRRRVAVSVTPPVVITFTSY